MHVCMQRPNYINFLEYSKHGYLTLNTAFSEGDKLIKHGFKNLMEVGMGTGAVVSALHYLN